MLLTKPIRQLITYVCARLISVALIALKKVVPSLNYITLQAHCLPANCNGHGKCNIVPYIPQCICDDGWEGSGCDTPSVPVVSSATNLGFHLVESMLLSTYLILFAYL